MSMLLMVKAMQSKVGNPLRKLVLIKLADNANDQGECWPSYQYIADQCEMSKRSVMAHIEALTEAGFLRKELRLGGVKGNKSNVYTLMIPSAGDSLGVVQEIHHPSANAAPPSAGDSLPPSAGAAPRICHSLEPVKEPVIETKSGKNVFEFSEWPYMADQQIFNDWVLLRKSKRAPVTQTVINQVGKELTKAVQNGWTVNDALAEAVFAGWHGFKYEWLITRSSSGKQSSGNINQIANAAKEYLNERQ